MWFVIPTNILTLFSAFTGFETNNKYEIKNSLGQRIYFAAEGKFSSFFFTWKNGFMPVEENVIF